MLHWTVSIALLKSLNWDLSSSMKGFEDHHICIFILTFILMLVLVTGFPFPTETTVSLLLCSQKWDTETLQFCRTDECDPPLGSEGGLVFSRGWGFFRQFISMLILKAAPHLYVTGKTEACCIGKRRFLVKPPAWLAFNISHILDISPDYFPFHFRGQEQLVKEISCWAAITLLKWPLNFTALPSAKPSRSSTLRYLMSMFLICLTVHFLQCNLLKSQVSNVRRAKHCCVTTNFSPDTALVNKDPVFIYSWLVLILALISLRVVKRKCGFSQGSFKYGTKQNCCCRKRCERMVLCMNESSPTPMRCVLSREGTRCQLLQPKWNEKVLPKTQVMMVLVMKG